MYLRPAQFTHHVACIRWNTTPERLNEHDNFLLYDYHVNSRDIGIIGWIYEKIDQGRFLKPQCQKFYRTEHTVYLQTRKDILKQPLPFAIHRLRRILRNEYVSVPKLLEAMDCCYPHKSTSTFDFDAFISSRQTQHVADSLQVAEEDLYNSDTWEIHNAIALELLLEQYSGISILLYEYIHFI